MADWIAGMSGTNLAFGDIKVMVREEDAKRALSVIKTLSHDNDNVIENPKNEVNL